MSDLTFEEVSVRYGDREVVQPFTDRVAPGEWLGVIGPNGAGKSSLLRAVVGLVRSAGTMAVGGVDLAGLSPRARSAQVAYVPQTPLIPDDMTVTEYVLLGRTPYISYLGSASASDRDVATTVIERLDLGDFSSRFLGSLSGGERQRVVLARALAQEAPVLVLDEPTTALDIGHQQQALELVAELRREHGLTVVSALHDLTLAGTYADRLTLLDGGAVVATGSAADVLTAERLALVYKVSVSVDVDADGTVVVVPRRRPPVT